MITKLKVTIIIIATLIIGILLGVVGRGAFVKHHQQKLDSIERTEFFLSRVNEIVNPDSSQKPKVMDIAKRTAQRIEILFDRHQSEMKVIVDSMKRELAAVLRPEQQLSLDHELTFAQPGDSSREKLGISMAFSYEYAERLQRELDLDSAQTENLLLLIRESHDRIMKQAKPGMENSDAARKRRESFLDETNTKIEALLNPKQKEHFRQLQHERERFVEHELREEED
jgi:hypothetical protein